MMTEEEKKEFMRPFEKFPFLKFLAEKAGYGPSKPKPGTKEHLQAILDRINARLGKTLRMLDD